MKGIVKVQYGGKEIEIDKAMHEALLARRAQKAAKEKREKAPAAGGRSPLAVKDVDSITIGDDGAEPWDRRTVRYFNALATRAVDEEAGTQKLLELKKEMREMPEALVKAENDEAVRILKDAGFNRQKIRTTMRMISRAIPTRGVLQRTQSTLTDGAGQTLLAKPFLAEVFVIIEEFGIARKDLRQVPMTSRDLDLKSVSAKPNVGWVDELGLIDPSDFTMDTDQKLTTKGVAGLTSWSSELEEDEAISLLPIITMLYGEQFAQFEDTLAYNADGTSTFKNMTGITNAAANVVTLGSTKTHFSDITPDDLLSLIFAVSTSSRKGASFRMHPTILQYLWKYKASGSGEYQVQAPTAAGLPFTFWNYPIKEIEVMPGAGDTDVSTRFVSFGNGVHAFWGQRRGMTMDTTREGVISDSGGLVTMNAFQQDAAILRLKERIGVKIITPNTNRFGVIRTAGA